MKKKPGILTLIPTPIDDESPLEKTAFDLLQFATNEEMDTTDILVEDHKPCRRRWINWGLSREIVNDFICFNEHSQDKLLDSLITKLKNGTNLYLMSDAGLPAFCDPGQKLVDRCHQEKISVTATPFANSFTLALALSGLPHHHFEFYGFLPKKGSERMDVLKKK